MTITQAMILGLVQGITEFLPISSSGFLILIPEVFGWDVQSLAFDAFLHIATLIAIVAALWTEVKAMSIALFVPATDKESRHGLVCFDSLGRAQLDARFVSQSASWRRLALWIVLATIPVLVIGFLMQEVFHKEFRSAEVVAWSFIVWGIVLYLVDQRVSRRSIMSDRTQLIATTSIGLKRAILIGLAQIIALIPGTSRSGITITAGLATGLSRETAAKFSFLLAIPTIAAAGFLKLGQVASGEATIELLPLVVGFTVALVSAFLTVRFLLKFLQRHTFSEFAIFRVLVGIAILLLL